MDKTVYPIKYRNHLAAKDCYKKPFEIRKKYSVNGQGFLEVYLGDGKDFYKIEPEIRVHQKTLGEQLVEKGEDVLSTTKHGAAGLNSLLDSLIQWYGSYISGGANDGPAKETD